MPRFTHFEEPFDSYDYLPDNKRDPELEPLYPLIGLLLNKAMDQGGISKQIRLPPLLEEVMGEYTDKEAVLAYYNTGINQRLGMYNVVSRVFELTGMDLGVVEWFNAKVPMIPFKFFVEIYKFPEQPISEIIDLIYKIKNERSHLIGLRGPNCPPYFILDRSLLSSLHFLSSAYGEIYKNVKICWVDKFCMITPYILADVTGAMDIDVNIPPAVAFYACINDPPILPDPVWVDNYGTDINQIQTSGYNHVPLILYQINAYEVFQTYHYTQDVAEYKPEAEDPYGARHSGSMRTTNPTWGLYEPTLDFILDSMPDTTRENVPNLWGLAAGDFIKELKTAGVWDLLDLFYLLDAPMESIARTNLRSYPNHPLINNTANVAAPVHTQLRGIYGAGDGNWEAPSYDPNVSALNLKAKSNNNSMGVWVDTFGTMTSGVAQSDLIGHGGVLRRHITTSNQYQFGAQTTANLLAITPTGLTPVLPPADIFQVGRSNSVSVAARINTQTLTNGANAAGALGANFKVLGQSGEWSDNVISFAFAGAYLNATLATQVVTSCKKYRNRVASLLYAT